MPTRQNPSFGHRNHKNKQQSINSKQTTKPKSKSLPASEKHPCTEATNTDKKSQVPYGTFFEANSPLLFKDIIFLVTCQMDTK